MELKEHNLIKGKNATQKDGDRRLNAGDRETEGHAQLIPGLYFSKCGNRFL